MKRFLLLLTLTLALVLPSYAVDGHYELSFSDKNTKTSFVITTNSGDINIVFGGSGSSTDNNFDGHLRFYAKNTVTITAPTGRKLLKVELMTQGSSQLNSGSTAVADGKSANFQSSGTATWQNGSGASKLVITNGGTNGHAKITKIAVDIDEETSTAYWTDLTYTDGKPTKITSYEYELGSVTDDYVNLFPYNAPEGATYTSSNTNVAVVDANGYVQAKNAGTTTLKINGGGDCVLTVTGTPTPQPPVITFTPAPGTYDYMTKVTASVANATANDISFEVKVNDGSNNIINYTPSSDGTSFSFTLSYDAKVEVMAMTDAGDAEKTVEYTVKRPAAPTFTPAGGAVEEGTVVTFKSATSAVNKITYDVFDENLDNIAPDRVSNQNSANYTVSKPVIISAYAYLPNGYKSEEGLAEYTIKAPEMPGLPVFSIPDGSAVDPDAEVTVTAKGATKIYVAEYYIDGEKGEFAEYTGALTVNKMHRRFVAYAENKAGQTEEVEAFYSIKKAAAPTGNVYYKLVENASDLVAGDKIIVYSHVTTKSSKIDYETSSVMGAAPTSKDKFAKTIDLPLENVSSDCKTISAVPDGTMIIELEAATDGKFYLKYQEDGATKYLLMSSSKTELTSSSTPGNPVTIEKSTTDKDLDGIYAMYLTNTRILRYNFVGASSVHRFASYSKTDTNSKPVRLYKQVAETSTAPAGPDYVMTFHHTPYTGPIAGESTAAPKRVEAAVTDTEMSYAEGADGTTYSCTPNKLCGQFTIDIEGQTLGGHKDHAKTFECTDANCDVADHYPYMHVTDGASGLRLIRAESANHVPMSTNPDDHHGILTLHHNSTVKVNVDPFKLITMSLTAGEGGTTGVEDIAADNVDGEVHLYNLNGVEMPQGLTPAPGLYIRRQGNTATKVVIR